MAKSLSNTSSVSAGRKAKPPVVPATVAVMPSHLSSLTKSAESLTTSDGRAIDVWGLTVPSSASYVSDWASAFRQHYCSDSEIDSLRAGTSLSRAEYLTNLVFPDQSVAPGPGIRAGDFAELLVSDYVEYLLGYWVPRGKYADKASRDESAKGVDILGFQMATPPTPEPADILLSFYYLIFSQKHKPLIPFLSS